MHAHQPTTSATPTTPVIDLTTDTITWLTCAAEALGWKVLVVPIPDVQRTWINVFHLDHGGIDIVLDEAATTLRAEWHWNEPAPNPTTHLTVDLCRWLRGDT